MSLQEVALGRITKSNTHMVMVAVALRPVYHETKQLIGKEGKTFWKAIVRLVDQKGQGLYAEIKASESIARKRAQEFFQPKFIQLTQAVVVENSPFLSGFSTDVTNKGKALPVAEAHATAMKLRDMFPIVKSNFGVLTQRSEGRERADLIGKVTQKETPAMKVLKVTLWLKDESGQELVVRLWRKSPLARYALLSKIPAGIEASCGHWADSSKNMFSALHDNPTGSRFGKLQALAETRGEALSVPWLQTASRRMVSDGSEKFISGCATVSSCSLAPTDAMLEAQDNFIEVQLNSVWVTGILGDPMYVPRKNCGLKVDPVAGHCKRHAQQGCQTIREEVSSFLATVTLADHTGELDRVLVDGDQLQLLRVRLNCSPS
ncbi:unnamed protein product [Durusdinium trenchii]|uniref:Uncharacterized protein n=2 Tax=Durusdinium trenchii TaxID=1381693 RepID=A0ABP0MBV2_9DINO